MTCLPQGHVLGGDPRVSREPRPKSDTLRVREHLVRPITAYRQCLIRYSMRQEQKPAVRPLRQYHTRHECVVAKDRCAPPRRTPRPKQQSSLRAATGDAKAAQSLGSGSNSIRETMGPSPTLSGSSGSRLARVPSAVRRCTAAGSANPSCDRCTSFV